MMLKYTIRRIFSLCILWIWVNITLVSVSYENLQFAVVKSILFSCFLLSLGCFFLVGKFEILIFLNKVTDLK